MSKKITPEEIRHIAHLARLKLTDAETELFSAQLAEILGYVGRLGELDLKNAALSDRKPVPAEALRRDETSPSPSRDAVIENAPSRSGEYFKVKKVIE
ncbi:MAG: Asp-tRNA(Asn)/Glu-tRNA(Gln) amidotransferase GatCAB subunit C [Elusimicrobia bacterium HGW-Elusimicrobia-1]|jgi:aspartyl-tRNA(Asn)/glutamyl-tRNA(Gln) amidotransferase subunit C|nr:MAG: Asp-tRNA(Asn)/Glu-tRNA(Gln) amidotransferase GatCAB subunit C [Elusimicrobia bacterium HGW-Elusimicrobia-1]